MNIINRAASIFLLLVFFLAFFKDSVHGRPLLLSMSRPKPDDAALFARWLVSQNYWGVLKYVVVLFFLTERSNLLLRFVIFSQPQLVWDIDCC